jgi:Spy/CpxP family protein refolding chaperone
MTAKPLFAVMLFIAGAAAPALAQANDGPPDFEEMRQRAEQRIKDLLDVKDEEWKVLQPKLQKIQQLQRDASPRAMGMFGFGPGGPGGPGGGPVLIGPGGGPPPGGAQDFVGPGGPPPGGPDQPPSLVQEKLSELRETLQNKDSTPEDIKAKAQAVRDARTQAKADLVKAQADLVSVVTPRQEAALLSLGYLD